MPNIAAQRQRSNHFILIYTISAECSYRDIVGFSEISYIFVIGNLTYYGQSGAKKTMVQAILRWIRLQYYRYSTITGLYIMGNIESAVIQLVFFLIFYFLIRYTYAFTAQILKFGIPIAADLIQDK